MTDTQLLTIIASLGAGLFNNSRISDLKDANKAILADVGTRITDLRSETKTLCADLTRRIDDKFKLLDQKLDRIIEMIASRDQRLYRLEHPNERN